MNKKKSSKPSSDPGGFRSLAEPLKGIKPSPQPPPAPVAPKRSEAPSTFLMSPEARLWLAEEDAPRPRPSVPDKYKKKTSPSSTKDPYKKAEIPPTLPTATPSPLASQQENERLRTQIESLQQESAALRTQIEEKEHETTALTLEIEQMRASLAKERQHAQQLSEASAATLARQEEQSAFSARFLPLTSLLEQRGVPTALYDEAVQHLLQSSNTLLGQLRGDAHEIAPLLKKRLRLSCGDAICQEELKQEGFPLRIDDPSRCECCQNTESRRFAVRLGRLCLKKRIYRVVLVGGSPITHAEIQQLPMQGLRFVLVDGKQRRDLQQAANDMRSADLVVIWAPTMLQHKISDLYTEQQHLFQTKLIVIQTRGLASMLREVGHFLSHQPTEDLPV